MKSDSPFICRSRKIFRVSVVKELVEAGVHFGHRASRWNPKMAPYIYARKNGIHIVDIRETVRGLLRAKKYLAQVAAQGSLVLFVGTKRQAGAAIEREALRCHMPFVAERWLGGALTNFRTIRSRLTRLEEVERIRGSEELNAYSKKMQSALNREHRKMYRNLNGLRILNRMPECLVVFDPNKEKNCIKEARALGITTVALIDTDCDPDLVDLPIPGNDDGIRSIELIARHLAEAILVGSQSARLHAGRTSRRLPARTEWKPLPRPRREDRPASFWIARTFVGWSPSPSRTQDGQEPILQFGEPTDAFAHLSHATFDFQLRRKVMAEITATLVRELRTKPACR